MPPRGLALRLFEQGVVKSHCRPHMSRHITWYSRMSNGRMCQDLSRSTGGFRGRCPIRRQLWRGAGRRSTVPADLPLRTQAGEYPSSLRRGHRNVDGARMRPPLDEELRWRDEAADSRPTAACDLRDPQREALRKPFHDRPLLLNQATAPTPQRTAFDSRGTGSRLTYLPKPLLPLPRSHRPFAAPRHIERVRFGAEKSVEALIRRTADQGFESWTNGFRIRCGAGYRLRVSKQIVSILLGHICMAN